MSEFFWVPEDCIFGTAEDCLGAFPDNGPACLVANHVEYEKLKAKLAKACKIAGVTSDDLEDDD